MYIEIYIKFNNYFNSNRNIGQIGYLYYEIKNI